jgi:heat shock protein HtpX
MIDSRSARRRLRVVAAAGVLLLGLTTAFLVFPVALITFAFFGALGASWGLGWDMVLAAAIASAALGAAFASGAFVWTLRRSERRALETVRAWPHPGATEVPPPRLPPGEHAKLRNLVDGLAIAAGVLPPRCAIVIDDAPNCLSVGRRPETAWIVVTTGLIAALSRPELEAVLAYEIGRVATLDVSLDTVVYASTARVFELWAVAFDDFDEMTILWAPLAVLCIPTVLGGIALRALALRARARLSTALAVQYCRNPAALARALRRIVEDGGAVRRGDPGNAHLWLEYPHTRASRWFLGSHRILTRRIRELEAVAGPAGAVGE